MSWCSIHCTVIDKVHDQGAGYVPHPYSFRVDDSVRQGREVWVMETGGNLNCEVIMNCNGFSHQAGEIWIQKLSCLLQRELPQSSLKSPTKTPTVYVDAKYCLSKSSNRCCSLYRYLDWTTEGNPWKTIHDRLWFDQEVSEPSKPLSTTCHVNYCCTICCSYDCRVTGFRF